MHVGVCNPAHDLIVCWFSNWVLMGLEESKSNYEKPESLMKRTRAQAFGSIYGTSRLRHKRIALRRRCMHKGPRNPQGFVAVSGWQHFISLSYLYCSKKKKKKSCGHVMSQKINGNACLESWVHLI